jgi:hypothetical protein
MANLYEIEAIAGQTVFDLPFNYTIGTNELFVFWQGQLLYVDVQYAETSPTQVTLLNFAAETGDVFTFRVPAGTFNTLPVPTSFGFADPLPRPETAPTLTFS